VTDNLRLEIADPAIALDQAFEIGTPALVDIKPRGDVFQAADQRFRGRVPIERRQGLVGSQIAPALGTLEHADDRILGNAPIAQLRFRQLDLGQDAVGNILEIAFDNLPPDLVAQTDAALQHPLFFAIPTDDAVFHAVSGTGVECRENGTPHCCAILRMSQGVQRVARTSDQGFGYKARQFTATRTDRHQSPVLIHQATKKHPIQAGEKGSHGGYVSATDQRRPTARPESDTGSLRRPGQKAGLRHVEVALMHDHWPSCCQPAPVHRHSRRSRQTRYRPLPWRPRNTAGRRR
jgi:hypothetical protein